MIFHLSMPFIYLFLLVFYHLINGTIELSPSRSINPFLHSSLSSLLTTSSSKSISSPTSIISNIIQKRLHDNTQLNQVSSLLQISPPWNAPSMIWKIAWKIHSFLLPYLHYFDIAKAKDTYANLAVIWYDVDDDTDINMMMTLIKMAWRIDDNSCIFINLINVTTVIICNFLPSHNYYRVSFI